MSIVKYNKGSNAQLTKNFVAREFDCKCNGHCSKTLIDIELVCGMQRIREITGRAIIPTSGYRCPVHNANVGGGSLSYHMVKNNHGACDFIVQGVDAREVAKIAESLGFYGIGCYPSDGFVHVDTRPKEEKFFWYNHTETPTDTFGGEPGMYDKETDNDVVNEIVELLKKHGYV